ncbi:hypothetical protein L3X38_024041 [Prunus dulcis]|uniref:Rapid ALkalinization Factor n=1 Tax=Prunus dulcis TaxID=3755 RepID=A0AAD4Z642_PRUDU|nr:hypothetical protein L3X38_024041 [Prunus dulcis]
MASSKTFLLLGLMFAVVILIFSEVSARELAETTTPSSQGAVSCNRPGAQCHGKNPNPVPEHCKNNPSLRQCYKHGGHERGGEGDPFNHGSKNRPGQPGTAETETKN